MELLSLLFMSSCFLTLSGLTFGDQSEKPVIVREGDDAILPCSYNSTIENVRFEWTKEGTEEKVFTCDGECRSPALPDRVSHFRDDLKNGNASIKIKNVQLEDGGIYTCNFTTKGKAFRIELVVEPVLKDRNVSGAAKPYVTAHDQTNDGVLLQCDVKNAHPKPTVEWWDSNNQTIPSEEPQVSEQGERFNITLKATVGKTDLYRCVATQKKINHQTEKEIYVYISESNTGWIGWIIAGVLGVVVVVVGICVCRCFKNNKKTSKTMSSEPSAQEMKLNADQSEPM